MNEAWKVIVTDYEYESLHLEEAELSAIGANLVPCQCKSEEELLEKTGAADALLVQYANISERVIKNLQKCRIIVRYGIGVDSIDVAAATHWGIPVANVPDYGLEEVADHTLSLLLAAVRKIVPLNQSVKSGSWNYKSAKPIQRLRGSKLGLLAFGHIARLVAQRAKAFGLDIQVYDPYLDDETARQFGVKKVDFETVLSTSDFLSIHCPANASTYHMLDESAFKHMKPNLILINTARGVIIDESALLEALNNKTIAGAALDVSELEPIPQNSGLLQVDNCIITPHAAWYSEQAQDTLQRAAAQEIVRVLSGQEAVHVVNPDYKMNLPKQTN